MTSYKTPSTCKLRHIFRHNRQSLSQEVMKRKYDISKKIEAQKSKQIPKLKLIKTGQLTLQTLIYEGDSNMIETNAIDGTSICFEGGGLGLQ